MSAGWWHSRLGLAGGIDKDGSRAAELLAAGFDSVEFGTVTPLPEPGNNPGVAALAARLSALAPDGNSRIGIGLGMGSGAVPSELPDEWTCGLHAAWDAADYVSFNLSAQRYRPLLATAHLPLLAHAIDAVAVARQARVAASGRRVALTLKLPLGDTGMLPLTLAKAAADAGFDAITAVLPAHEQRLTRLRALASCLDAKAALIAVGAIRNAADVRAALGAGADGVQVHSVFAQLGAACLRQLRAD